MASVKMFTAIILMTTEEPQPKPTCHFPALVHFGKCLAIPAEQLVCPNYLFFPAKNMDME